MKFAPRISLRTVFLLVFCASVGLAAHPSPLAALEPAIATAVAIGLIQQVRQLVAWYPAAIASWNEVLSARWFAIIWRLLLTAAISTRVVTGMLVSRGLMQFPRHDHFWFHWGYQAVLPICLIIALGSSVVRWQSAAPSQVKRRGHAAGLVAIGVVVGILTLIDGAVTQFTTHKGLSRIEAASPPALRRPGFYPDLADELYRTLWLASISVTSLLAAGTVLVWWSRRISTWQTVIKYLLFASLLVPPMVFSYWYYTVEFYRVSSELAAAGLAAIWMDWLIGGLLAFTIVTIGAYQLGTTNSQTVEINPDLTQNLERTAFHESMFSLAIIAIHSISTVVLHAWSVLSAYATFGRSPPLWSYVTMLCNSGWLLSLALVLVVFQFLWMRWQARSRAVAWNMKGLSGLAFLGNWAALALLLIVGVPTLNAFGFLLWLGPWNLFRLFGY